jgi:hypothetical protein
VRCKAHLILGRHQIAQNRINCAFKMRQYSKIFNYTQAIYINSQLRLTKILAAITLYTYTKTATRPSDTTQGECFMILKIFIAIVVIVAVAVGLLNTAALHTDVVRLAMFGEFFSAALPVLAFGALVKYLCTCSAFCKCGSCSSCKCCNGNGCRCCGDRKSCPTTVVTP